MIHLFFIIYLIVLLQGTLYICIYLLFIIITFFVLLDRLVPLHPLSL